jgi:hypothetical protein
LWLVAGGCCKRAGWRLGVVVGNSWWPEDKRLWIPKLVVFLVLLGICRREYG